MNNHYICDGNTFTYNKGYIGMPVVLGTLPDTVAVEGVTLQRKDEFHVSLVCVKNILAQMSEVEERVLALFCEYIQEHDMPSVYFTGAFRFAENDERKTLVALCEVENLTPFFDKLNEEFGIDIPYQPTHVTLYTLQPNKGIGLNTPDDLATLSREVNAPEEVRESLMME
ncbi:MAG: hypothetical protein ACJKTH_00405 [Patescibacteria group bacterium UBA2163]